MVSAACKIRAPDTAPVRTISWLPATRACPAAQVANRCCRGRVVSVLEGGYRIQGACVSAFARSVAAHVRALQEANHQARR